MTKTVVALLALLLAACGSPSPTDMTVAQWIKLDQKQRTEAVAVVLGSEKYFADDCEKTKMCYG